MVAVLAGLMIGRVLTYREPATPETIRYEVTGTLQEQAAALEGTVEQAPEDAHAWRRLGVVYVQRASEVGDPTFYDLAQRALERARELDPGDAETLLARSQLALSLHDFDEALDLGTRVRRQRPFSPAALGVVVDARVELGQYDQAAEALDEMLALDPSLPALSRASYLRELHGDMGGAIEAMQQAETAGSGSPFATATASSLVGDLHFATGDIEAAEAAYQRALRTSPGLVAAQVGTARVTAAKGDPEAATAALNAVVDRYPHPAAAILLAELQAFVGDEVAAANSEELIRTLTALQLDAGVSVDLELAVFEADHGNPDAALRLATLAHEARPDNVYVADAMAWALFRNDRAREALPFVEQALRLGSADPLVRFHAAVVLAETGNVDSAREHLRFALDANPWFSFVHRQQARDLAGRLGIVAPATWRT